MRLNRCLLGDCRDGMATMQREGVRAQCVVTPPPYWVLRDYGIAPARWPEVSYSPMPGLPPIVIPAQRACLGLERDPSSYVAHMVEVFRTVRSVLADDGIVWLNLGDSYASNIKGSGGSNPETSPKQAWKGSANGQGFSIRKFDLDALGVKPKDLLGIPWRVAFALQADGWHLRQDIIWHKPNPMPESVTDRCTKAHEYLFLLAKRERYYFDADAIKEPATQKEFRPTFRGGAYVKGMTFDNGNGGTSTDTGNVIRDNAKRNRRSVWTIATSPYKDAHFATFPPALVEPCILAGSRPGDLVLDPFLGSGTVAQVAKHLNRDWMGCEVNPQYVVMQSERVRKALRLPAPSRDPAPIMLPS